jgi:colanic acid/amylovoran biosynthesis protein
MNALEVKGIISQCYMTFSSRYHGIVSSLNTGVPCLATSWSHKYETLFKDFNREDCVLDPKNHKAMMNKIGQFLDEKNNLIVRKELSTMTEKIKNKNREMWAVVWKIANIVES